MKYTIGVRREDLSKRSEMRAAVSPIEASMIVGLGHPLLVQSGLDPKAKINKRAFADQDYAAAGAKIEEDLSSADIIFGLKEIKLEDILPEKTYLFFSHTHKGQTKNREMLKTLVAQNCTVIDYELITDDRGVRLLTAFTYFAGYGGMIDSLWTFGKRMALEGIEHPFSAIPQSIEKGDLGWFREHLQTEIASRIKQEGTPPELPPMITCILGRGKTSTGAQEIYDLLPSEEITLAQLEETYRNGSRHKVYKLVLEVYDMYRLKPDTSVSAESYAAMSEREKFTHYLENPEQYESNLDQILPYTSMLLNCILWSAKYPRVLPNELMANVKTPMRVIGDITCDPNGAIEFSKETWVDDPVYSYISSSEETKDGFDLDGVQVMAVTNLPCAFSADASRQFAKEVGALIPGLLQANLTGDFESSQLPDALARAVLLWKGEFTPSSAHMKQYL